MYQLTGCIREQARSHIGVWCLPDAYLHHFFRLRLTIPKPLATLINLRVADRGAPLQPTQPLEQIAQVRFAHRRIGRIGTQVV